MRNPYVRLQRPSGTYTLGLLTIVGAALVGSTFLVTRARPIAEQGGPAQDEKTIHVTNRTRSIEVVKAERDEDSVHIILRNNSTKPINGLQVRVGDVAVQTEFLGTDINFPPGGLHEERYPTQQDSKNRGVQILCVLFDDGSSDGVPKYIKQIEDTRVGESTQTLRALLLIDKALAHPNVNAEVIEKLKKEISSLPEQANDNANQDIVVGLKDRKAQLIGQINAILSSQTLVGQSGSHELIALKERLNRSIKQ